MSKETCLNLIFKHCVVVIRWHVNFPVIYTLCLRKSNTVVSEVELCVEFADEHIAQDP